MKSRTFAFRQVHGVFVLVHRVEDPHDDEWAEWVKELFASAEAKTFRGVLVESHGGSPNGRQRGDIKRFREAGHQQPLAIMMDSRVGALMVSALGLFGANVRGFRLGEWDAVMQYLKVTSADCDAFQAVAREFRQQLDITM